MEAGPTIAKSSGNMLLQGPSPVYWSAPDELPGVPAGYPTCLRGESAWAGCRFNDETRFIYVLTQSDLAEVSQALAHFKGRQNLLFLRG